MPTRLPLPARAGDAVTKAETVSRSDAWRTLIGTYTIRRIGPDTASGSSLLRPLGLLTCHCRLPGRLVELALHLVALAGLLVSLFECHALLPNPPIQLHCLVAQFPCNRFAPPVQPEAKAVVAAIEAELARK